ncbi:MAG TPA: GPP34 family phosphoprotein [Pilimelia sp.]|nr:GPP34 family phosphoprotein [Pilimelia sp.]
MLADQFYLIAHEDRTGRSRLHPRATGLGLAASLVGELMLMGRVRVVSGELAVVSREPPGDALAHTVLALLVAQPQHRDLRIWLAFLAQDAAAKVGQRLLRAGVVEPVIRRKLLSTETRYMPMNSKQRNTAAWASVRLANILIHGHANDVADRLLAGLVVATGLTRHVLWDLDTHRSGLTHLHALVESLPAHLRELVEHTEASVGSVLAAGRR